MPLSNTLLQDIQDYNSGDPTKQKALINLLAGLGIPITTETLTFLGDEASMQMASGRDPFTGFHLHAGDDPTAFFQLVGLANTFGQITGFKYFPTAAQLQWGLEHGMAQADSRTVYGWMATMAGIQDTQPWAAYGMTKDQYIQNASTFQDTYEQYTGTRAMDYSLLHLAQSNNWTQEQFLSHLQQDPSIGANYGWVKHGYTYNQFLQYKTANFGEVATRFGPAPSNQDFVANLDTPLTPSGSTATAFGTSQTQNQTSQTGRQSQVR